MSEDHHNAESISRRGLLNGLVTAASKPWRHGQHNGHTSNAMVFPTITTAVNTSPACRTPTTNSVSVTEEQRRRLQQQRNQERRLNVLWYGGDDLHQQQQQTTLLFESHHNRYHLPATDNWEKQPLRKRRQKSEKSRRRQNLEKRTPTEPIVWATMLYAIYAVSMAGVYYTFGITSGSGWIWLRGVISNSDSRLQNWLCYFSPAWYYVIQTFCAFTIGCLWYRWFYQQEKQQLQHRWWCYVLLALFTTALLPSVPLAEVFSSNNGSTTKTSQLLENSTAKQVTSYYNIAGNLHDSRLILYEGLWQVLFFMFVAYCFVLPINNNEQSYNKNNINRQNNNTNNFQENNRKDHHVTKAVLLFTVGLSFTYTALNAYTAYCWYCQHRQENNLLEPIKQQLVANIVALTCINLTGWLLRQHILLVRSDISDFHEIDKLGQNNNSLHLALRWQADKLNRLLTSLVPKRVFLEMKNDIVADAARSYYTISNSNDKDYQYEPCLQRSQQDIQLLAPQLPKMYLKEYDNVSVIYAKMSGFWYNTSPVACHGGSGTQSSRQIITLIDRLFVNLFNGIARRNHCLPIRLLGQRIVFVAGLPAEENYEYNDDECDNSKWTTDDNGHAKDAIRMGLDLINAINMVVHDVSRSRYGHKIDLNIRVGVHSGRVTCGVLGFTGGLSVHSNPGSRWKYDVWGRDVQVASKVESNGRPGRVHVSRDTVNQITKNGIVANAVISHHPPSGNFHNNSVNYSPGSNDNKGEYTFEHNEELRDQFLVQNHIDTFFVVPNVICANSEINECRNPVRNRIDVHHEDNDENYSDEDMNIVSLILQSVEHQLQAEEARRRQYVAIDPSQEIELASELQPTIMTTAVVDLPLTTAALITPTPVTAMMIMNRHRRSRYEQEPLHTGMTIPNTCSTLTTTAERPNRWEDDVFKNYDCDNIKNTSADSDLFRLAIAHLLLLCVVIALFVVNMTTMPWTLLLGITFIIPFVIISGELIYVMALLIDWVRPPKIRSNNYVTAIIADDNEYYQHYDSDHYSDSSCSSNNSVGCFSPIINCCPNRCLLLTWFLKPFQWLTNTVVTTENALDNNSHRWWFTPSFCRCFSWPTWCLNNERSSSISSDECDIESRPGFRNENAILASMPGLPLSQHLQNHPQYSQMININRSSNKSNSRIHQRKRRPKRKYQDEMRCTGFFWLSACCEMFVVLLVCLLALLNAFTCEPVVITATGNAYNESSNGFNTISINSPRQQYPSPLTCQWPQYAVITCCLACLSIAIAFPIYYGSLPTLWMKIIVLFIMICVFPITFIHFTHRHVFIAASMMSVPPACCGENPCLDRTGKEQLQTQNLELQKQSANLITVTATVYVIIFTMAILIYSIYAHRLKIRQASHRVKTDRDIRRLNVLRAAHRRTLRTIIPDHVAHSLQNNYSRDTNDSNEEPSGTWHKQTRTDNRSIPIVSNNRQSREHIPTYMSSPLYHRNYQSIVAVFATIVQDQFVFNTNNSNELNEDIGYQHHQQLVLLHEIFSEFDKLLDNDKFRGLVEKIKIVGTNTYMVAVGLERPEHLLLMQQEEFRQRINGSCHSNNKDRKKNVDCTPNNDSRDVVNEYALYDVTSANYVIFALDFVREMRRALHRWQTVPVTSVGNLHLRPARFTLRVGLNVGPAVAGLIGCNDGIWKRPQFDIWGSTVNVARQMDTTGVPGSTQVTNCVVEVMKSVKDPEYEFEIRTQILSKGCKRLTYFVRENFERLEDHQHLVQQHQISNYQQQQRRQITMGQKSYHHLLIDSNQQKLHKNLTVVQPPPHNMHRTVTQQPERDQPSSPLIQNPQHSFYSKVPQEFRYKCAEPQKSPPPPPPPSRSPPPINARRTQQSQHYPMLQHQCSGERDRHSDQLKRSRAGIQLSNDNKQQYYPARHTPDANIKTVSTYARPLQQQQQKNNKQLSSPTGSATPVPRGLVLLFGDDSQQSLSTQNMQTVTNNVKSNKFSSNHTATNATTHVQQQLSQPRRPNMLALRNTTAAAPVITTKKFDADRPLPAPPRSSDTVAGRQRNHNDPRRRRRQQNQPSMTSTSKQLQNPVSSDIINNDQDPIAWPLSSAIRSPISAETFVSTSSVASSLSSSGSTDAGGTTTSNNNYNTTTTASSSEDDDSFGRTETEDGGGIDRVDIEDFDTAASSIALSPIHHRYHHHQQHLQLRQWSPSTTTANSSPVRRSSSFRSPLSGGDNIAASSSSLRSPPVVGNSTSTGFVGTQSLNRRRMCSNNGNSGGSSSSRRRRRRQQQQQQNNTPVIAVRSSSPSSIAAPEVVTITNTIGGIVTTERYESPPLSPWKKQQQQQRRQIPSKDQGTSCAAPGPDFTDEIRRILLLDQHRGNVRQQQQELLGEEIKINKYRSDRSDLNDDKKKIVDEVIKQSSSEKHGVLAVSTTVKDRKRDKNDENNQLNEKNVNNVEQLITKTIPTNTATNLSSASSFEERERQITEQVKRQQAEVRRILQEHKNKVVSVVRGGAAVATEAVIHGHRKRVTATTEEFSEWSDDESVDPSSSLLNKNHREQCIEFPDNSINYEANRSVVTADAEYIAGVDCDGYTTGGDGDGYTTTGYTTDEAAATADVGIEMVYATATDSPIASVTQHLDDNLSTMNDTGLTDAEGALSDVNSMIYYNDHNEKNNYGSRRQSSLSSRYASDSYCDDDDDDDDDDYFNDNNALFFRGKYDREDEEFDLCDDDGSRYNLSQILQEQELSSTPDNACADYNKRLYTSQMKETEQSTLSLVSNAKDSSQKSIASDGTAVASKTPSTAVTTALTNNDSNNIPTTTTTTTTATTTTTTTSINQDEQLQTSSTNTIKDNLNLSQEQKKMH